MRSLQQVLALAAAAKDVAGLAVGANLAGMPGKGSPALDLNGVDVRQPSSEVIATIPLKPAPWVGSVDPAFLSPYRERLPAFNAEIVHGRVRRFPDFGVFEPFFRQLAGAIVAVFAFKAPISSISAGEKCG